MSHSDLAPVHWLWALSVSCGRVLRLLPQPPLIGRGRMIAKMRAANQSLIPPSNQHSQSDTHLDALPRHQTTVTSASAGPADDSRRAGSAPSSRSRTRNGRTRTLARRSLVLIIFLVVFVWRRHHRTARVFHLHGGVRVRRGSGCHCLPTAAHTAVHAFGLQRLSDQAGDCHSRVSRLSSPDLHQRPPLQRLVCTDDALTQCRSLCCLPRCLIVCRRVKCPTCRADHALQRPAAVASPAAYVRRIPQNADIVQLIRRSAQLEAALQEQQWVQVQQQQRQPPQPNCAFGSSCAEPAVRWCDDCDAAWCAAHNASAHGLALAAHRRMAISAKQAARQTKVAAVLAAAGASLKASATASMKQQQCLVERLKTEEAEQRRAAEEKQRQLDEALARLAQVQVSVARLHGLRDIEAQQQSGSFADLILFPPGASGLLASLSGQQLGHLCRFLGGNDMVSSTATLMQLSEPSRWTLG